MYQGMTMSDLATEVFRRASQKRDYLADTREIDFQPVNSAPEGQPPIINIAAGINGHGSFPLRDRAHQQMGQSLGIRAEYYGKMREQAPDLLAYNLNYWGAHTPLQRTLRTLDGDLRAVMSERYRPLDDVDLMTAVMPVLSEVPGLRVESTALTEERFYLKVMSDKFEGEVKLNDPVKFGMVIRNSEVGAGAIAVEPLVFRLVCLNGMIVPDYGTKARHVGRGRGGDDDGLPNAVEFYRDETREADDRAFWMKVQDTVRGAFSEQGFQKLLGKIRETTEHQIEGKPIEAVQVVAKQFGFTEDEKNAVFEALIEGGDRSQWGLLNAVTYVSQSARDYERATELETVGGKILNLAPSEWKVISHAGLK